MSTALRYTASRATTSSVFSKVIASFQGNFAAFWNNNRSSCVNTSFNSFHLPITASSSTAQMQTQTQVPITINSHAYSIDASMTTNANDAIMIQDGAGDEPFDLSTWLISTLKRRKKKMNKHKLQKRRKLLRAKNKK